MTKEITIQIIIAIIGISLVSLVGIIVLNDFSKLHFPYENCINDSLIINKTECNKYEPSIINASLGVFR